MKITSIKQALNEGYNQGYQAAIKDMQPLIDAAIHTINDNLHLCDGDNCTLKELRNAVFNLPTRVFRV